MKLTSYSASQNNNCYILADVKETKVRLLLIEDDPLIGEMIKNHLHEECYAVDWLRDGRDAELALKICAYDLLILDLGLPGKAGMDILRSTRLSGPDLPVMIISGHHAKLTRIEALDAGADEYLVKPFNLDELKARIRALLRRGSGRTTSTVTHGSLTLNLTSHEVTFNGHLVQLPRRQFSVLRALLDEPGCVISKRQIEEKLYCWDTEVHSNTVNTHIYQLRKKFGSKFIQTLRGVGYKVRLRS